MAENREMGIIIRVKDAASAAIKGINAQVTGLGKAAGGFGSKMKSMGMAIKAAWLEIIVVILALKKAFDVTVGAFAAEEEQVRKLNNALSSLSGSYKENKKQVDDWIASIQKTTKYGDDAIREVFIPISARVKDLTTAMKLSEIAL